MLGSLAFSPPIIHTHRRGNGYPEVRRFDSPFSGGLRHWCTSHCVRQSFQRAGFTGFPLTFIHQHSPGVSMAKRSMRSKSRDSAYEENVHPLFPGRKKSWTPHEPDGEARDRKYVKNVRAMSPAQQTFMDAIDQQSVVLALGPAGTGKTYLAIAKAVEALEAGKVQRIVLSRPAVEAGESLGFLPGDLTEKLAPYLRPLYDALTERLGTKRLKQMLADGIIEIAPVA